MSDLQPHPIADLFPTIQGAEWTAFVDSIRRNGQREPIVLFEGRILDGRNRARACAEIGVEPKTRSLASNENPWEFVWDENANRRHLSAGQQAVLRVKFEHGSDAYREERERAREVAKQKRTEAAVAQHQVSSPILGQKKPDGHVSRDTPPRSDDIRSPGAERVVLAQKAGVSSATMSRALDLKRKDPERFERVARGELELNQAARETKREEALARIGTAVPLTGKYRVFYADPPWQYGDSGYGHGPAEFHYPTMPLAELCALPIAEMALDDAVLFLWTTSPLLEESFKVIGAWGFKYKASFVWDKVKHNVGHYNSVRHELLLIATRGSCTPDDRRLDDSVVEIERTEHSVKPDRFREIIDRMYPNGSRLELFARRAAPNWDVWGNQAPSDEVAAQ